MLIIQVKELLLIKCLYPLTEDKKYDILVGLSVCEELIVRPQGGSLTKEDSLIDRQIGGTSFNIALAAKKVFGLNVKLMGSLGSGPKQIGRSFVEPAVTSHGIDFHPLPVRKGTAIGIIRLRPNRPPKIYSCKPAYISMPIDEVASQTSLSQPAICVASGVMKEETPLIEAMFKASPKSLRILNPRGSLIKSSNDFTRLLKKTHILMINHEELSLFLGEDIPEDGVRQKQIQRLHQIGVPTVIVTCNAHGAVLSHAPEKLWLTQPVVPADNVIDTTGAGDSFLSGVVAAIARKKPPQAMLKSGATLASLVVRRQGGSNLPSLEQFKDELRKLS